MGISASLPSSAAPHRDGHGLQRSGWLDQWIAIFIIVLLVIVYYGPLRDSLGGGV